MKFELLRTAEFDDWFKKQPPKTRVIIEARFDRLESEGHWGFVNKFDGLIELKWPSGLRIYTARYDSLIIIALNGGNKNGQSKDIKKAKNILSRYIEKA